VTREWVTAPTLGAPGSNVCYNSADNGRTITRVTWVLLIVRLPAEPSRHRVSVWRALRRSGAVPVAPGVWAMPATPAFLAAVDRAADLARRGDGGVVVLDVAARDERSEATLREAFTAVRLQEWAEFVDDCGKFETEIAKEIRTAKFTLAELEEEEQSLDRLRRWYRDLKARDVLELPAAGDAEQRLKGCMELLEDYADRVYGALHGRSVAGPAAGVSGVGDG